MFVTLRGEPWLVWRAVDEHGIELDILLQNRRDKTAAKRFLQRVLAGCTAVPKKIVTNQLRSLPAAKAESQSQLRVERRRDGTRTDGVDAGASRRVV